MRSVYFRDPNGIMLEFAAVLRGFRPEDVAHAPARAAQPADAELPRLRQVPRAEATSEVVTRTYDLLFGDRDPVAEPGTTTGTTGDWWTVFALVPDVLEHANRGFALYRNPKRKLDPVLRELGADPRRLGQGQPVRLLPALQVAARPEGRARRRSPPSRTGRSPTASTTKERAVLAYTDCLALQAGRTPDAVFATLKGFLSRRGDPGAHLHHLPLRHARGDEPGAAH